MKLKKIQLILSMFLIVTMYHNILISQNKPQKDNYGREIINKDGQKINFSKNDNSINELNVDNFKNRVSQAQQIQNNANKLPIEAKVNNLFTIMGTSIGRVGMKSIDIDNDGIVELICSASSSSSFGLADFWYIMHYNESSKTCDNVWSSSEYVKNISAMEVIDFDNDKYFEILICFEDGTIQIYDGLTKKMTKEVKPVNQKINSIVFADGDNDNNKDIVIACDNNIYILNAQTFAQKFVINQGSDVVRIGNVDSDPNQEIVLSYGAVYRLVGTALTYTWRFNTKGDGLVELSDIDNDSKQEIIFAENWQAIRVYDADSKTTKYAITTAIDINTLYVKDVNNDGVDEILYGDGQWGKVNCYNAVTRTLMWSVANPAHGVAAINYSDLNNDGVQELIWTAGFTSTGADYMYIHNVLENKLLWRSDDIVGPFYAITKGDVDHDGKDEIVAVSYESESGYGSGVLLIIDAQTNKLKWKSDGDFFNNVWTGVFNVCIKDIDNDEKNEIIVAAGETYTGKIWIIDGKNHVIKDSNLFSSDGINEFKSLVIDDIDNDKEQELIVATSSNVYAIRPSDWAIKWKILNTNLYYSIPIIRTATLNGDNLKETIVCNGNIQIIYGNDQSYWTSEENNFVNFDLFDKNQDGILDIVTCTSNGHIITFDGNTRDIIEDLNLESSKISSVRMQKVNNSIVYIYSCDGRINFYKDETKYLVTQSLGNAIGEVESLKIIDLASDPTEILVGTAISVLRLDAKLDDLNLSTSNYLSDNLVDKHFQIFPNPVKNEIFLKKLNSNIENYSFDLIDNSGRFIKKQRKTNQEIEKIDTTNLTTGLYYIRICIENKYYTKKIIKE